MTADVLPAPRTLADVLVPRSIAANTLLVLGGVAVVSALAYVEIPMWPVPITGQTLGVIIVGAALGARRGAMALLTYAVLGLLGLPIFAGGGGGLLYVLKPSFGFILGFIPAAALVGWLAERRWDRRPLLSLAAFVLASTVPFLVGVPYMGVVLGAMGVANDPATLLALGVVPFLIGGLIKCLLAAAVIPFVWRLVKKVDRAGRQ